MGLRVRGQGVWLDDRDEARPGSDGSERSHVSPLGLNQEVLHCGARESRTKQNEFLIKPKAGDFRRLCISLEKVLGSRSSLMRV